VVAFAALAFDDGVIKRVWLSLLKDLVRVIRLSEGRDVVRVADIGDDVVLGVLEETPKLLPDEECEEAVDDRELVEDTETEDVGDELEPSDSEDDEADFELDRVTMMGDGADCALSPSCEDDLDDETATDVEL
jgi:hypothetical protein